MLETRKNEIPSLYSNNNSNSDSSNNCSNIRMPFSSSSSSSSSRPLSASSIFGGMMPTSSAPSTKKLVIERNTQPDISFSWSDIPMVVVDEDDAASQSSSSSSSPSLSYSSSSSLCSLASATSIGSRLSDFSSTSSRMNLLAEDTEGEGRTRSTASSSSLSHHRRNTSRRNTQNTPSVQFAPQLQVRTYSLVLGDHPSCEDGLALELGWDYASHEDEPLRPIPSPPSPTAQHTKSNKSRGHCSMCSRRSYLDRKVLLLTVAGCSEQELTHRTTQCKEEKERQHNAYLKQYHACS